MFWIFGNMIMRHSLARISEDGLLYSDFCLVDSARGGPKTKTSSFFVALRQRRGFRSDWQDLQKSCQSTKEIQMPRI